MQARTKDRISVVNVDQKYHFCRMVSVDAEPLRPEGPVCAMMHRRNCKSADGSGIQIAPQGLCQT